jgi:hypothetical protein
MATVALVKDLIPVDLALSSLFLDPNNPRFASKDSSPVQDDDIDKESVQDDAAFRLIRDFGIEKLKMNMEVNGYLPIDRVIVRQFKDNKFVVLEGNRRICAAKLIAESVTAGVAFTEEVTLSLKQIPCLQYVGMEHDAAWIFQGLRHITGVVDWSAFNKAKLLVEQVEDEGLNLTDVGRRFGLTAYGAGQWVRGYYAFKQALEDSDFVKEVDERSYPYFQELFSRSSAAVREWLEWDEDSYRFKNVLNFNEFVSWLYPRPTGEDGDEEAGLEVAGDWDKRPLRRRDDIRQIAYLIREDKRAFEVFRRERDVEKAYAEALQRKYEKEAREKRDQEEDIHRQLKECTSTLENLPHKLLKTPESRGRLFQAIEKLEGAIRELRE